MDIIFEILSQLTHDKNGVVADSMTEKGVSYKLNYGVALHTIKKIAQEYAPDHELAQQLYARDEREAKLAAIFIEDPEAVAKEQVEEWAADFTNTELAEVACSQLLYKTPYALAYSYEWCKSPSLYLQKAGWTLATRLAQLGQTTNRQLMPYLTLAESADLSQAVIQQAVISALVKIGTKNEQLRNEVILAANRMKAQSNSRQVAAREILAFLAV